MIKLEVIGRLGADAEMKSINGQNYISYSVCHSERGKDGKDHATWVNVMQMSKDSQPKLLDYLTKGTMIYTEGNPSVGAYIKDGTAVGSLSLWTFKLELLGKGEAKQEKRNIDSYVKPTADTNNKDDLPW